jgi:hypothetical protein
MPQSAPAAPTRLQKLLEKALEEISIGSPDKAQDYIELAIAEETAAPQLHEALEFFFNIMHDYESSRRKGYVSLALNQARAALAKAKGGAA